MSRRQDLAAGTLANAMHLVGSRHLHLLAVVHAQILVQPTLALMLMTLRTFALRTPAQGTPVEGTHALAEDVGLQRPQTCNLALAATTHASIQTLACRMVILGIFVSQGKGEFVGFTHASAKLQAGLLHLALKPASNVRILVTTTRVDQLGISSTLAHKLLGLVGSILVSAGNRVG